MSIALLDADIIAYRSSAAAEDDTDWGDGCEGPTVNESAAVYNAHSMVRRWLALSRCERAVLCLSPRDGGNFRRLLGGHYKAGRTHKPVVYYEVLDSLEAEWETKTIHMLEADDVMGILHTSEKIADTVVVSMDKDMETIPGKLVNPFKDKTPRLVRPAAAALHWMTQTLVGDPVDEYKGCPKIGKVKAERALAGKRTVPEMWAVVLELFEKHGDGEEQALRNARFARILHREDYDKEKERVRLWHPNPKKRPWLDLR